MEELPQELISRILSRLPAKELLKCKCVCKSWFVLITDPHFIANYDVVYNNLTRHEEHLLVIRKNWISGNRPYISVLSWDNEKPKGLVSSKVLNPPDEYNFNLSDWTNIMGPCNGIYFLNGNPNVMMNPSLRQFRALPQSHFTPPYGTIFSKYFHGFGFDPKTNDYKVVVVMNHSIKERDQRQRTGYRYYCIRKVELYSLNSNSWRKLDNSLHLYELRYKALIIPTQVYTYVNNCYHWKGYVDECGGGGGGGTKDLIVISFDMVSEGFRKIKVPKICESWENACGLTVAPFNESSTIGFVVYPLTGCTAERRRFDVWVMRDYWDEGSWIKRYSVEPMPVIDKLVGFYGGNRFLWIDGNNRLVLYEGECGRTWELLDYGKHASISVVRYVESLVSLRRGNESSHLCFLLRG